MLNNNNIVTLTIAFLSKITMFYVRLWSGKLSISLREGAALCSYSSFMSKISSRLP